ncbi:TetR/AcrR family transcriptional regulator [Roseateles depolymerans]|uniref:TetR family transcriptional regulator n=1 Tax=Roseateles depolymerans TaxID=76731 RepID=A0A0U3DX29_9BURK|nr:TetR family transcriptional regulator [Roseateles depolymerans]ALV05349.1 TetR family transcriptional regulator [Roseateles depolymerans]REG14635.1 TetR family transcriptional regulator [Roseateles depolymerans]
MSASPRSPCSEARVARSRGRPCSQTVQGADALLRTARGIFARRGYEATSVRDIARQAGVDAALIAHHFGSKEALWRAVVEQIACTIDPMLVRVADLRSRAELSPRQRVEQALEHFMDRVFEDPDIGMFFSTAATEEGERLNLLVDRMVKPFHAVFLPLMEDAIQAQEIRACDPALMFSMLTHGISKTVAYAHVMRAVSPLPEDPVRFKSELRRVVAALLA